MRISLELVVVAIVILIVAIVVIGIFTGGLERFMSIFGIQSEQQIKQSMCANACSSFCMFNPEKTTGVWGTDAGLKDIMYKGKPIDSECITLYKEKCECTR